MRTGVGGHLLDYSEVEAPLYWENHRQTVIYSKGECLNEGNHSESARRNKLTGMQLARDV